VLCTPRHDGVVGEAASLAPACGGCRSFASAAQRATRAHGAHREVVVPPVPPHVGGCPGLGSRLLNRVPRPFAAWSQRRAWLLQGKLVRELIAGATAVPVMLFAYRDQWLVGQILVRPFRDSQEQDWALTEAASLGSSLGAQQIRLVADSLVRADLDGTLPEGRLSDDPGARMALVAHDWDAVTDTAQVQVQCYAVDDRGRVVFDDAPLQLPYAIATTDDIPTIVRQVSGRPHLFAPIQYAAWIASQGHRVAIDPLPAGLAGRPIRVGVAHRQAVLRAVADHFKLDLFGLPEPHRLVLLVPAGRADQPWWHAVAMYASQDEALGSLGRSHATLRGGLLVDLDATEQPVRPVTVDPRHHRVQLGRARSLAACPPDRPSVLLADAFPTLTDRAAPEPPELPGPTL
jgi:hypothetical protein